MSNDLILAETLTPAIFLEQKVDPVLDRIRAEVAAFQGDISTEAGRKEIASFAHKIARSKTALDDLGKSLVESEKKKLALVDAERKRIRDTLDNLKAQVRKPLDAYLAAEENRLNAHEDALKALANIAVLNGSETADELQRRIDQSVTALNARAWEEFNARAVKCGEANLAVLSSMFTRRIKYDEEQAELTRLRAEDEARKQREREEAIAKEAADKARREAEAAAERDREALQKQAEAAEAAAKKAQADAEAAVQRERDRVASEAKARAEVEAMRYADEMHMAKVEEEVFNSLLKIGLTETQADAVLSALVSNEIQHVKLVY